MEPNTFAIDLLDAAVDEGGAAVPSTSASTPARSVDGRTRKFGRRGDLRSLASGVLLL